MTTIATTTVRLPEGLKAEAEALAGSLGISMTALMAVALRDYLDRPVTRSSGAPSPSEPPAPAARSKPATKAAAAPSLGKFALPPSGGRRAPCPCGSGLRWNACHGR